MKKRIMRWPFVLLGSVLLLTPGVGQADLMDVLSRFHPYVTLQEEYSDNINLTDSNTKEDFITTLSPGIKFSTSPARVTTPGQIQQPPAPPARPTPLGQIQQPPAPQDSGLELDYRLGLVAYARETQNNYVGHEATLEAWTTFARHLTLRLADNFIRSEEPRERNLLPGALPDQFLLGTQRDRAVYIRNIFAPSLEYRFGPENRFFLRYLNNLYENESPEFQDSRDNVITPRLVYWFNIRNGISLEYGLSFGDFERSPDFVAHLGKGRYTYRFNPRTSVFGEYTHIDRNFDSPGIDYRIHNPSLGFQHAFSPTLSGTFQAGYFWQRPKEGDKIDGISYDLLLIQRVIRTTYTLSLQGGYTEDYFTAENLGFARYHRLLARVSHRYTERLTFGLSGSLERAKFLSGRKDWIWRLGGDALYPVFRWLNLSFRFTHQEDDSNIPSEDYKENRAILSITAIL